MDYWCPHTLVTLVSKLFTKTTDSPVIYYISQRFQLIFFIENVIIFLPTFIFTPALTIVYWFHLVRPSVRPSVDGIISALYLQHSLDLQYFVFIHLIRQLQKVCCMLSLMQKSKIEVLSNFLNLQLWLCLVLAGDPIWTKSMCNHGGCGGIH